MIPRTRFVISSIALAVAAAVVACSADDKPFRAGRGERLCAPNIRAGDYRGEVLRHRRADGRGVREENGSAEVWSSAGACGDRK